MFQPLRKYVPLTLELTKLSLLTEMEYRFSFAAKVLGIMVNDAAFLFIWYLYFRHFPSLNGWNFNQTMLLIATTVSSCGWVLIFARGLTVVARSISRGDLDYYLSFPVEPLWLHAVSKSDMTSLGDLLFATIVLALYPGISWGGVVLFLLLIFLAGLIFTAFLITTQSLAFYVANFEDAAEQLWWSLGAFGFYPQSAFQGTLRVILMTVFPAFFMWGLPVEIFVGFSWQKLAILAAVSILSLTGAIIFFTHGLKRYESGNLISPAR